MAMRQKTVVATVVAMTIKEGAHTVMGTPRAMGMSEGAAMTEGAGVEPVLAYTPETGTVAIAARAVLTLDAQFEFTKRAR
jgi:hypothetical protein